MNPSSVSDPRCLRRRITPLDLVSFVLHKRIPTSWCTPLLSNIKSLDAVVHKFPLAGAFFSFQYSKEIWRPLYKLALHYLSCPPSSVYSERVFSTAGNLVTNRRRRLLPQNVEEMMFIKMNWKFHEEEFSRQLHYSTETFGIVDSSGDELILCEDDAHTDEDVNDDNIWPL